MQPSFEFKTASGGRFYFVLKAGNGEVIATSGMYTTAGACTKGAFAVVKAVMSIAFRALEFRMKCLEGGEE